MPVSIKVVLGKKCIPKEWPFYWQKCNNPFDRLHSAISPLNLWNLIGGILFYKSAPLIIFLRKFHFGNEFIYCLHVGKFLHQSCCHNPCQAILPLRQDKLYSHFRYSTLNTLSLSTLYVAYKHFTFMQPLSNPSIIYTRPHFPSL